MKWFALCVALVAGIGTATAAPSSKKKDFVFVGTVFLIEQIAAPDGIHNFRVSCSVDRVLSGQFVDPTFSFAVHSPARARLERGGVYEIEAKATANGYRVDEWRIRKRTDNAGTATAAEPAKKDLVFVGRVLRIDTNDNPIESFSIRMAVDQVLAGELAGSTFTFAIHSPARAMLEVGGVYEIKARWTGEGYRVSETEIRRREKTGPKPAK
jgi:hypothetical protein